MCRSLRGALPAQLQLRIVRPARPSDGRPKTGEPVQPRWAADPLGHSDLQPDHPVIGAKPVHVYWRLESVRHSYLQVCNNCKNHLIASIKTKYHINDALQLASCCKFFLHIRLTCCSATIRWERENRDAERKRKGKPCKGLYSRVSEVEPEIQKRRHMETVTSIYLGMHLTPPGTKSSGL